MKILVIGGNGTIGKSVAKRLQEKHEVIIAGRNSGDLHVNIEQAESIQRLFEKTGKLDAIVNCAGATKWASFNDMHEEDFYIGIRSKMMGQINLVRIGQKYLEPKGSFTLTSGILADDPVDMTSNAAMVNGALHSFVIAVAPELENGHRINVVAPGLVEDSKDKFGDYFPGHTPVSMYKVANGYVRSVEGKNTGEVIRVYE